MRDFRARRHKGGGHDGITHHSRFVSTSRVAFPRSLRACTGGCGSAPRRWIREWRFPFRLSPSSESHLGRGGTGELQECSAQLGNGGSVDHRMTETRRRRFRGANALEQRPESAVSQCNSSNTTEDIKMTKVTNNSGAPRRVVRPKNALLAVFHVAFLLVATLLHPPVESTAAGALP